MIDPNDHFVLLQEKVRGRLAANDAAIPSLEPANNKPVPFVHEQMGDLVSKVSNAISSLGIVVIVLTPTALLIDPKTPELGMYAPVLVQIQENVLFNQGNNGTKIPALRMVAFVMKRLQNFSHQLYVGDDATQRLRLDPKPFVLIRDEPPLTYNVAATAMIDLGATLRT